MPKMGFAATFILLVIGANGVMSNSNRIAGGSPTTINEFPFISNMKAGWYGFWLQNCGGTLISRTSVVSAAHCYKGYSTESWRVVLGTSFASSGGVEHTIRLITLHQEYNDDTADYDVAVVRLTTPATLSDDVGLARIAALNYDLQDDEPVQVLGWGLTWFGGFAAEQLKVVELNIVNHDLCTERYKYLQSLPLFGYMPDVTDRMVCSGRMGSHGFGPCEGDIGGPVLHNHDVLVGIVSWGYRCGESEYPSVSTRVSVLSSWIVDNAL